MLEIVKSWIDQHSLLEEGDCVLAACSGGPDSIALVHILNRLQDEYGFLLSVAHVDHTMRGRESEEDAEFVAEFCLRLGLPFYQTKVPVEKFSIENRLSTMDAARILRFQFLRDTARALGGAKIATGHHRDDQSETVLINLFRGAGSLGLKGMRPQENGLVRPLLAVGRRDIEKYCARYGLQSRLDSSNLKTDYLRNQIRLELLPYLEREYNPNIRQSLWRISQIAADEYEYIHEQSEKAGAIHLQSGGSVLIDREKMKAAAPALRRGIIRLALEKCRDNLKGISFDHVEMLVSMAIDGRVGTIRPLPGGLTARVDYHTIEFSHRDVQTDSGIEPPGIEINLPGKTAVAKLGIQVHAELQAVVAAELSSMQAVFDWNALQPPIFIRTRAEGDRFQPIGMKGTKKIKDFFIDAKIPRENRDKTAIFSDMKGIIWIAGHRQSERGKISKHTNSFLRLSISKQEDTQHD